jgi:hypothetical protein
MAWIEIDLMDKHKIPIVSCCYGIYFNSDLRIILSNYFNSRNGIKMIGLKDLYKFIISRKFI